MVRLDLLSDISVWISVNMLMLNQEKAELIIFKPKHQVGIIEETQLRVGEKIVCVAQIVKILNMSLNVESQVSAISKVSYYQIRNIGHKIYLGYTDTYPDNIIVVLQQWSSIWPANNADDTSTEYSIQLPDWSPVLVNETI